MSASERLVVDAGEFTVEFVRPPAAKVTLLSVTPDAGRVLAAVTRGYSQVYGAEVSEGEIDHWLEQIDRTRLKTPLEFVQTTWLIQGVTRAWTHQAVRTRVGASFVQQSLRFADMRRAQVLISPEVEKVGQLGGYMESAADAFASYSAQIAAGVPIQDARNVLPHGILTNIFVAYSLSTLANVACQRFCCQAQGLEWGSIVQQMKEQLPPVIQRFVKAPWDVPGAKSCGFSADFDRKCEWPERFQRA